MQSDHERIRELFVQASEMTSPEEREAFLDRACGTDARLRESVQKMLALEGQAGAFFSAVEKQISQTSLLAPAATPEALAKPEGPGSVIDRYKLLEQIGEGGFGVVYMAEQVEPVTRRVALKIIKLGMDTREVIARFEAERQALALMDHPNVARVLDAGATNSGRPYFVMELVRGLPVTEFCDRKRLTPHERIKLFMQVCQAVQHAHSKSVIHRDLKPSNILVTELDGQAIPKIIDFGIAKAIEKPLTEKTLFTHYGQMIGTPVYMSPEQTDLSAVDVDTRSDVYSLGVVFYELLTGNQPFDVERLLQVGRYEMMRIIREEDPPRPSTRLTTLGNELATVAERRHVNPRRLSELVRGDLDWITMRALQKDRARRYETAAALADDLQRYLEHRPVRAGPPSLAYRSLKFAQRHRYAVATLTWILVSLLAGLALAIYLYVDARNEQERALAAERTSDQQSRLALAEARRAQANELRARQVSYSSDMALTSHALELGNLGRALALLNRYAGDRGAQDLRAWEWRYLWQQCQSSELFHLGSLSSGVLSISVSADGKCAAATDLEGDLVVWDLAARNRLWGTNAYPAAAVSPDGKVVVGANRFVRDAESGLALRLLPGQGDLKRLAFSPNSDLLAALAGADRLCLWNTRTWELIADVAGFYCGSLHFGALAFFHGQPVLAVGTEDGQVQLIDLGTRRVLRRWKAHDEGVTSIAVTPDSKFVVTGAGFSDEQVKIWKAADGTLEGTLKGHSAWVTALAFSPDGQLLASASADQSVRLWDFRVRELLVLLRGHLHEVWSLAFLPDGKALLSGGKDGSLKVWRVPSLEKKTVAGQELQHDSFGFAKSLVHEFAFAPDGRELLALDKEGTVNRWGLPSLRALGPIESLGSNNFVVVSAPQLGLLAAVKRQGAVSIWDWDSRTISARWELGSVMGDMPWFGFASASRQFVSVRGFRHVDVWNPARGSRLSTWEAGEDLVGPFGVSPDGRYLACGGKELVIHSLTNGAVVARIAAHRGPLDALAFSPDASLLATASQEGLAKLWRTDRWQETGTLRGHLLGVHSVAFSPDGRRLATGSLGKEAVKLWDLATMQEVVNIPADGHIIFWLSFSPDSRNLVSFSSGGLKCWSAPLLQEIRATEELRGGTE